MTAAGWRAGAGTAAAVAVADPGSWALGLLGFLVRGGLLLVLVPILSVPSPVLLSILFRGEVGMIGRGELRVIAIGVGVVLSIVAIGAVVVSAYADLALAERFMRDPESEGLRRGRGPVALSNAARRSLLWWVASVQAVALLPVIGAVSLLVAATVRVTTDELLSPSTVTLSLVERVIPAIGPQLVIAGTVLVIVEGLSSLATRRLMANAWGLLPDGPDDASETRVALRGAGRLVRRPMRVAATALAGWLVIGLVVGFVLAVTLLAWSTTRDVLVAGSVSGDPLAWLAGAILVTLFASVWIGGLGLLGFAAALRSGLWTADAVR